MHTLQNWTQTTGFQNLSSSQQISLEHLLSTWLNASFIQTYQDKKKKKLSNGHHRIPLYAYIHTYVHTYIYICMYTCICMCLYIIYKIEIKLRFHLDRMVKFFNKMSGISSFLGPSIDGGHKNTSSFPFFHLGTWSLSMHYQESTALIATYSMGLWAVSLIHWSL
jgi:hypothetical protein